MEWLQDNAWAVWLAAAMLLGVAELASLDLVLLMLAAGCLVGAGVAAAELPFLVQALAAALASTAMLLLVRPSVVHRLHSGPTLVQGHAALVGQEGFALSEVDARGAGQVKLAGEVWTARPYDETAVIPSGARVQVFEIRGATAYVHEVPELWS
jgi:membrane protein implicated in regulation of membrane protease activity